MKRKEKKLANMPRGTDRGLPLTIQNDSNPPPLFVMHLVIFLPIFRVTISTTLLYSFVSLNKLYLKLAFCAHS
ncbi:hypothetical protein PRUPE_1G331800 [Prunus persica]|uniref:Transmembrane protein n=1 Tax=Prunus persica TaxID=3760 RepID=A0A251R701_PRUPE|nr:hypothetical protein PRUPE_1G331800 [Prunus persica]